MLKTTEIGREIAQKRFAHALRLRVGHGRDYSLEEAARITGIPDRTLRSYREDVLPPVDQLLLLVAALDAPELINAVFGLAGYGGLHRIIRKEDASGMEEILHALATEMARITGYTVSGHPTPQDKLDMQESLERLAEDILSHISIERGAAKMRE